MAAPADRALRRLPEKAVTAVVEFMSTALTEAPERVGKPLRNELAGLWSARRGPYRIVYEVRHDERVIVVVRIAHRSHIYRPA